MSQDRLSNPLSTLGLAFRAGIYGGIVAGGLELLLVARFGMVLANFSGLLFALIAYGLLGGFVGVFSALLLQLLPFHRERRASRRQLSAFLTSTSSAFILFLIFVFRAFRDFHAEKVKPTEPLGLLTIVLLLVAAIALFFFLKFLFQNILDRFLEALLKPVLNGLLLLSLIILGVILQISLKGETEVVRSPFSPASRSDLGDKSNVIIIMADALRYDRLGCYGHSQIKTPNIDALAKDGVLFQQMYAQTNNTKPSTATILSSRYLNEHRAIHKTDLLPANVITLPEVFGSAGYYCGGIVSNVNLAPVYNFQQGFHEYTYLAPDFLFGANEAASRLVLYGVLRQVRMKLVKKIWVQNFYQSGETVTRYFEDFLNRQQNHPFFLFLHYMDPHDPYFEHPYTGRGYARVVMGNPPAKYTKPFEDYYAQEIAYMDDWIGRVTADLKKSGWYDRTLIIFTSDHGEEFYDHGGWWHGTTLHEEQLRVPLIIKRPASATAGTTVSVLTNSIDLAPTALQVAGLEIPEVMRGRALFDSVAEDYIPQAYSEADFEGNVGQSLRLGPWKYIQMNPENARHRPAQQLFNLAVDPQEKNNLVNSEPEKVAEMKALLEAQYRAVLKNQETGVQRGVDAATQERMRALGYTQ